MTIANRALLTFVLWMLDLVLILGLPCLVFLMIDYIGRSLHTWSQVGIAFYQYNQARKNCTCGAMKALFDEKGEA